MLRGSGSCSATGLRSPWAPVRWRRSSSRCQQRFVFFKFDPAIRYRVPPEYGNCGIEVVGDPGTQFELIQ